MKQIGRSSIYLSSVSNRLAASSSRSRFLGMIVGMALSQLFEPPGKAMKFDIEEMESDEAVSYINLIRTKDDVGSLESLRPKANTEKSATETGIKKSVSSSRHRQNANSRPVKIVSIEEVDDSRKSDDDDDLIPYEKPDMDPSDSEDDPTLIQRGKPAAPV